MFNCMYYSFNFGRKKFCCCRSFLEALSGAHSPITSMFMDTPTGHAEVVFKLLVINIYLATHVNIKRSNTIMSKTLWD